MKIKIYLLVALLPFLACRHETSESDYLLNIRYELPPDGAVFTSLIGMKLLVAAPGTDRVLADFWLPGFSGEWYKEFDVPGGKQFDRYDLHFIYETAAETSVVISYFNVPNGAQTFVAPRKRVLKNKIFFSIIGLPPTDTVYAVSRSSFSSWKINQGVFTGHLYVERGQDQLIAVKPENDSLTYYYKVPAGAMTNSSALLYFKNFAPGGKKINYKIFEEGVPISIDVRAFSPAFDTGMYVYADYRLTANNPLPGEFEAPAFIPDDWLFAVSLDGKDYSVDELLPSSEVFDIKPPNIGIEKALLTGNRLEIETKGDIDYVVARIHTGVHYWTICASPTEVRRLELPNLAAYVKPSVKPESFVNEVRIYQSPLYEYKEMRAGFPFSLSDLWAEARCGLVEVRKAF